MEDAIVLYPSPGRGHLITVVELGKVILSNYPCFSIFIIIPPAPFETVSTEDYTAAFSAHVALPPNAFSSPKDFPALTYQLTELNNTNLHHTLLELSKLSKLKAFIIDFLCNASFQVSSHLNIPTYYYFTCGINGLAVFVYFPTIHKIKALQRA